jgi:hypothetical protein
MTRSLLASAFTATFMLMTGCATMNEPERQPISLEEIVAMSKAGKDAPTIIGEIKLSRTSYDVQASQYAKLSRDGVPDAVLDYMQQGQLRMAERQGRREAYQNMWLGSGWYGYGYGTPWYPRRYIAYVGTRPYVRQW